MSTPVHLVATPLKLDHASQFCCYVPCHDDDNVVPKRARKETR